MLTEPCVLFFFFHHSEFPPFLPPAVDLITAVIIILVVLCYSPNKRGPERAPLFNMHYVILQINVGLNERLSLICTVDTCCEIPCTFLRKRVTLLVAWVKDEPFLSLHFLSDGYGESF